MLKEESKKKKIYKMSKTVKLPENIRKQVKNKTDLNSCFHMKHLLQK